MLLLCCCLSATAVYSQVFKGRILTGDGDPIPFASLYIHELSSGLIADDEGRFSRTLAPGTYICEVSSLGYTSELVTIEMGDRDLEKNIILNKRVYELEEVSITRGDEDPAYPVMRQAIARAPYYRTYVRSYTAGTYLKGTGKVTNIPALLKLSKTARETAKKYTGRLFVLEEQRKVKFTAPNSWDNEILAYSNSFPEEIQVSIETSNVNLYQPTLMGKISPLNPRAFSFYRFKLEGYYEEGGHLVNKIRVIPRRDNPELIEGYIYIIDDLWCLSAIDLKLSSAGFDATINVTCKEVKPAVFMNTSASVKANIHLMGVKGEASFLSAIHYTDVVISQTTIETSGRIRRKQPADTTRVGDKYERKTHTVEMKRDSLAEKRDSAYWASVRSVPLRPEEMQSYAYKEELKAVKQDVPRDSTSLKARLKQTTNILLYGKEFRSSNDRLWLKLGSLGSYIPEYNFVDGLWLGMKFTAGIKLGEESQLTLTPEAYYTSSRQTWVGGGTLVFDYAPRHLGKLSISGGVHSADFNGESGESRLINSIASLYFGRNDVKLYNQRFWTLNNDIEITNGLLLSTGMTWQRRTALDNTISRGLFGREAKPNLPRHPDYAPQPANELLKATVVLQYTPPRYYWMRQGRKIYEPSSWPSMSFKYERAFAHGGSQTLTPGFHLTEFSAWQKFDFGLFNNITWAVNAGAFWDAKDMQFPDFKHFTTTRLPVTEHTFNRGLALLDNYIYSTSTRWAQANVSWYTPYLLLKQLPFLQSQRFDEALHLRSLAVYDRPPYWEVGYSIGFLVAARAGVFVGFESMKYQSVGISVSLPLLRLADKK